MGVFEAIASSLTTLSGGRETRSYLRRKLVALVLMAAGPPLAARLSGWGADPGALPPRGRMVAIGNDLALNVVEVGSGW